VLVTAPPSSKPGVNGCVSRVLRSSSRNRICNAGPTVATTAPDPAVAATCVNPQTPPRKSVVSVVHVCPLEGERISNTASYQVVLNVPWHAVHCSLSICHWWKTLGGPRFRDLTTWPYSKPTWTYGWRVILKPLVFQIGGPLGRITRRRSRRREWRIL
jgi:hypothetical protein